MNGWRAWIVGIVGALAALGVAGVIKNAMAQAKVEQQVEINTEDIDAVEAQVKLIPVIQNDIEYIKENIDEIKDNQVNNKKEILEAIDELGR